jgi:hypothetical protein
VFHARKEKEQLYDQILYKAQVSGYHMAAFFGLEHIVLNLLLDEDIELSRLEPKLGSVLFIASAQGDCSLVRLLLDNNGLHPSLLSRWKREIGCCQDVARPR